MDKLVADNAVVFFDPSMEFIFAIGFGFGVAVELRDAFSSIVPHKSAFDMYVNIMGCVSTGLLTFSLWPIIMPYLCLSAMLGSVNPRYQKNGTSTNQEQSNGYWNRFSNGSWNRFSNGYWNRFSNESSNGSSNGFSNGSSNGFSNDFFKRRI
jgi:hypothetical protein